MILSNWCETRSKLNEYERKREERERERERESGADSREREIPSGVKIGTAGPGGRGGERRKHWGRVRTRETVWPKGGFE